MNDNIQNPLVDKLWGTRELATYLGYTEATVERMVNRSPERLPPRVGALGRLKWNPVTVRSWAVAQSEPVKKKGRRRVIPALTKS